MNPNSLDSVIARMAVQIDQVNDKLTLLTATMKTRCDQLEARLETLETQKAWVVGVTTGVSIVMGLIWTLANKLWK